MIDLNSSEALRAKEVEMLALAIDAGMKAANDAAAPRSYLGASAVGDECERRIQLDYIHAKRLPSAPQPGGEGFSPLTLRIFAMGHAMEDLAIAWLRQGKFDVRTRNEAGRQFGFSVADGDFAGHCDGVIVAGPEGMKYPAVWEHKAVGRKSWQEIAKHGVAKSRPAYAVQIAIYQAYFDLTNPALFMATNRDTGEIHLELVPFDAGRAQAASDRAVRIIQATRAGELMPRPFADAEHFQCKMCSRWAGFCWG